MSHHGNLVSAGGGLTQGCPCGARGAESTASLWEWPGLSATSSQVGGTLETKLSFVEEPNPNGTDPARP